MVFNLSHFERGWIEEADGMGWVVGFMAVLGKRCGSLNGDNNCLFVFASGTTATEMLLL
jgi:hypothetical protein